MIEAPKSPEQPKQKSVVIIDNDTEFSQALVKTLSEIACIQKVDLTTIRTYKTFSQDTQQHIVGKNPDLVLVDTDLTDYDNLKKYIPSTGIPARLRRLGYTGTIVALRTTTLTEEQVQKFGFDGFLTKSRQSLSNDILSFLKTEDEQSGA